MPSAGKSNQRGGLARPEPFMEETHQGYYCVIPAHILQDERLADGDKLAYALMSSVARKSGVIWASNKYLSDALRVAPRTLQRRLGVLEDAGYIRRVERDGDRQIFLVVPVLSEPEGVTNGDADPTTKTSPPHDKSVIHIDIVDSNTRSKRDNDTTGTLKDKHKARPKSVEDVIAYGAEIGLGFVECQKFYDYYETTGWRVGKARTPMKSWRAAARNWKRNAEQYAPKDKPGALSYRPPMGR